MAKRKADKDALVSVLLVRGTREYAEAFRRLQTASATLTAAETIERALALLAAQHGLTMPPRARPWGTNQHK